MAKTPRSAAKSAPAPETAQTAQAPVEASAQNALPGEGASGTAPGPEASEPARVGPTSGTPEVGEAPSAGSGPEVVTTVAAEGGVQPAPPHSVDVQSSPAPETAPLPSGELGREELRAIGRASMVQALSGLVPDDDDMGGRMRLLDEVIVILATRLADDALFVVSTAGRKYRVDRTTGAVTDTATGEVVL